MSSIPQIDNQPEHIQRMMKNMEVQFEKNFNNFMPGALAKYTDFNKFKKRYPSLLKVITYSMVEASTSL